MGVNISPPDLIELYSITRILIYMWFLYLYFMVIPKSCARSGTCKTDCDQETKYNKAPILQCKYLLTFNIDGLVQERRYSSAMSTTFRMIRHFGSGCFIFTETCLGIFVLANILVTYGARQSISTMLNEKRHNFLSNSPSYQSLRIISMDWKTLFDIVNGIT